MVMFMQRTDSRTAHENRHIFRPQTQPFPVGIARLQGQGAQAEGDGEAGAALWIGQTVEDPSVGDGLAAAGRGQIDPEEPLLCAAITETLSQIERGVLPAIGTAAARAESFVASDTRETLIQSRQRVQQATGVHTSTDQMLIKSLIEARLALFISTRIGVEHLAATRLVAVTGVAGLRGIVVIGQHQHETAEVKDIGTFKNGGGFVSGEGRSFEDRRRDLYRMLTPMLAVEREVLGIFQQASLAFCSASARLPHQPCVIGSGILARISWRRSQASHGLGRR